MRLKKVDIAKSKYASDNGLQYKSAPTEVKDADEKAMVYEGYLAAKNVKDSDNETITDGAFLRSVKDWGPTGKNRIKLLWQHNPTEPIGKFLDLVEDEYGLKHRSQVSNTRLGKDAFRLILDGVITEHSIGYSVLDAKQDLDDEDHYFLTELKLWEGSPVTWGANEYTPVTRIVSGKAEEDAQAIIKRLEDMERSLRKGVWETDEVPFAMEMMINQLRPAILGLGEALKSSNEARQDSAEEPEGTPPDETQPEGMSSEGIAQLISQEVKAAFSFTKQEPEQVLAGELTRFMEQLRQEIGSK